MLYFFAILSEVTEDSAGCFHTGVICFPIMSVRDGVSHVFGFAV